MYQKKQTNGQVKLGEGAREVVLDFANRTVIKSLQTGPAN